MIEKGDIIRQEEKNVDLHVQKADPTHNVVEGYISELGEPSLDMMKMEFLYDPIERKIDDGSLELIKDE